MKRRGFLRAILFSGCAPAFAGNSAPHVAVFGGGFGGMSVLRALQGRARLTLIEPNPSYFGCPGCNLVVSGFRPLSSVRRTRENIGWETVRARAMKVESGRAVLADGSELRFDRAAVAPGVELDFGAMPGYSESDSNMVPHAWRGGADGAQAALLRKQIEAMPDGGVFIILPPEGAYSCSPAPYERASLAAARFMRGKPRAKILVIDPKEHFAKQALFSRAWRNLYGDMIEWRGGEAGGIVESLSLQNGGRIVETEFGSEVADVLNYIPPQRAGGLAWESGLTDESGWCPVRAEDFESLLMSGVHVIGDAALTRMPKSADAARSQGAWAARGILRALGMGEAEELWGDESGGSGLGGSELGGSKLDGSELGGSELSSACYSLAGLEHGLASVSRYRVVGGMLEKLEEKLTPLDSDAAGFRLDAEKADEWHRAIMAELFGGA